MIRLGIIGTNWITTSFIEAALTSGKYELTAAYSRSLDKAQRIVEKYQGAFFTDDFDAFITSEVFDVCYIASPNALHFPQAMALMENGKHVIVEKPIFSNSREFVQAKAKAEEQGVFLFEAARHIHEENFKVLAEAVKNLPQVDGACFNYLQYSSRYDKVLVGEEPNIFSLHFSGGALMDIGVYPVYVAVTLFGMPQRSRYFAQKIATGVDGSGTILLEYPDFSVTILCSKTTHGNMVNEIYSGKKTIQFAPIANIEKVTQVNLTDEKDLTISEVGMSMLEEANDFADIITKKDLQATDYQTLLMLSGQVAQVLTRLREDAEIVFDADKKA